MISRLRHCAAIKEPSQLLLWVQNPNIQDPHRKVIFHPTMQAREKIIRRQYFDTDVGWLGKDLLIGLGQLNDDNIGNAKSMGRHSQPHLDKRSHAKLFRAHQEPSRDAKLNLTVILKPNATLLQNSIHEVAIWLKGARQIVVD